MKNIPLIKADLPALEEIEGELRALLTSGRVTNFGQTVQAFEAEAAAYLGSGVEVATTSSATAGLILTLQALGVGPGKRVVLPSFTFVASAQAVLYAGGTPLFADIEDDLTISTDDLAQLVERYPDIAVVLPVHMYGYPCPCEKIEAVAAGRKLPVLYDAAHAFGSSAGGRKVGTMGAAEVFSLSVTKVLVSVEGGMVASRDPALIRRIKKMRNYGIEENYDAHYPGLNGKMSELHALIGLHNLRRIDSLLTARQERARYFMRRIGEATRFCLLPWPDGVVHTFKDFTVLLPDSLSGKRDSLMAFLKERGIETRAYFYPPVHEQTYFRRFADRALPRTEALARRVLTLPFYATLGEAEMDYMADVLAEAERRL